MCEVILNRHTQLQCTYNLDRDFNYDQISNAFCVDHLCYLCLKFVMLYVCSLLYLWSPARKGLPSRLLFVIFNCVFVTFQCGILGQVWYLILSIPDLCRLLTFKNVAANTFVKQRTCAGSSKPLLLVNTIISNIARTVSNVFSSYCMVCASVRVDNPQALASGLSSRTGAQTMK